MYSAKSFPGNVMNRYTYNKTWRPSSRAPSMFSQAYKAIVLQTGELGEQNFLESYYG